ncbi:polysaccharide biosynthesis C-terminal domain-containing protein [Mesonia sp. K4-1]|uniref:oligosaccharide flippase family protein n=1 Tax=Mesonia sp. K4-1 TaxID=2602760 RepID=UPI0011C6EFF2|nr:polysaccharide biosynthesis C-terminal domain-containing protein [Mesonia sp. K4-1]TXK77875.1 oligosaccharide flippase family protein [Mesonia sp. K4-1]
MQKKAGVVLSYFIIFLKIFVVFFYVPFVLKTIGKDSYGLFTVVSSIIAYISILDFGLNDSTLRYFVKFRNSVDINQKISILSAVSKIYTTIGGIVIVALFLVYFYLDLVFINKFTTVELTLLKKMYIISGVSIFFTIFLNPIGAILSAYEKFIFLKLVELISFVITTIIIVIFLNEGYGVLEMIVITGTINIIAQFIKYCYCRVKLKICFPVFGKNNQYIKDLVFYGSPIFVVVLVEQIYWKLDNILIGAILGTTYVTYYAMGLVFQKYILSFSTAISRIMTPNLISQIDSGSKIEILNEYIKISRLQLAVICVISLNLALWGEEFLIIWLGEEYKKSYLVLLLILIPFTIENIGNVRNVILQVYKLYWIRALIIFIISILNIGATYVLLNEIGIDGAALSTSISLIIGYIFTNILLWKKVGLDLKLFFIKVWGKAFLLLTIIIVTILLFKNYYVGQISTWFSLILCVTLTGLFYFILIWFLYLNLEEKKIIKKIFSK